MSASKDSKMLQKTSKDYQGTVPKSKSYQDDKRASSMPDKSSNLNHTKNSSVSKRTDSRSVVQNNINIGTMVGNLQLGTSMTSSNKRWSSVCSSHRQFNCPRKINWKYSIFDHGLIQNCRLCSKVSNMISLWRHTSTNAHNKVSKFTCKAKFM